MWSEGLKVETAYRLSSLFIALLIVASFLNLYLIVDRQKEYAKLINLAGKQRLQSERIRGNLLALMYDPSSADLRSVGAELSKMREDYDTLRRSFHRIGFQESNLYTAGYGHTPLRHLYDARVSGRDLFANADVIGILEHHDAILSELNRPVEQLQRQSDRLSRQMIVQGGILLAVILGMLGVISFLIFKPLFTRLGEKHRAIQAINGQLEAKVREIERLAITDPLTGVFNRHRFNEEIQKALVLYRRHGIPSTLAILDIDHFKTVNDTYGHITGDCVLVYFADILRRRVRRSDTLARWGGEEFVILFANTSMNEALVALDQIMAEIQAYPFDQVGQVTCSIGVSVFQSDDTAESLVVRADNALYRAKEEGRNRICTEG